MIDCDVSSWETMTVLLTTSSSTTPWVHELKQFGIDGLPGLRQHPDKVSGLPQVTWGEEGVGSALVGTAGRTSNTVDVILRGAGIVIVDDELDIFHIFWMKSNWYYSMWEREKMIISRGEKASGERIDGTEPVCI